MTNRLLQWFRRTLPLPARSGALAFTPTQAYVHPCVIDRKPHIVYPRGLRTVQPELYNALAAYYRRRGYALKEDRRGTSPVPPALQERRRKWVPILLFTADLLFEGTALAETRRTSTSVDAHTHGQVELMLAQPHRDNQEQRALHAPPPPTPTLSSRAAVDAVAAERIYALLRTAYEPRAGDPTYVLTDFRDIANYYSGFPEVVAMLADLANKKWRLVYDEQTWATVANGNVFEVNAVRVHFNTRSAAQLKLYNECKDNPVCIASPADALLHELLHAHSMLVNTREFIAQGGMSAVMYPYKHEYTIIDAERRLYASMSYRDAIKRPQRVDHTGRPLKAQCATCIR